MAGKKTLQWPKDMEESLIEEVKKHSFLYDLEDPLHAKRSLKTETYVKISQRMGKKYPEFKKELTYEEVLRKFSNLRKYYVKETRKQLMLDPSVRTKLKWEHSENLSFLDEYLLRESNDFNLDEPTIISFEETIQDRTDVHPSSTQTSNRTRRRELATSKPTEMSAGRAIAKAAAALEEIASTMTDNLLQSRGNGVPSSPFKQRKRGHGETEDHIMARAAEALERIANAPRKTPEELFFSYYSERILRIRNPILKRRFRLELEELVSRYEEEDEEISSMS